MRPVEQIEKELGRHIDHIDHSWENKQVECAWYQRGLEWVIQHYDERKIVAKIVELENMSDPYQIGNPIMIRAMNWALQKSRKAKNSMERKE